jgi:hypothetical protein
MFNFPPSGIAVVTADAQEGCREQAKSRVTEIPPFPRPPAKNFAECAAKCESAYTPSPKFRVGGAARVRPDAKTPES